MILGIMIRTTPWTAAAHVAICTAALAALSGCGSASSAVAPASPIPLASSWRAGLFVDGYGPQGLGPATTESANPTDATQQTLAGLGIATDDFATGSTVKLMPNGDTLTQSTLHYCGAEYPSEQNRVARRLVAVYDSSDARVGPLSDAVQYDTPQHAAAALDEIRNELAACQPNTVVNTGGTQLVVDPQPSDSIPLENVLPEAQRAVMAEIVTEPSSGSSALIQTLWQQDGSYLVALTIEGDSKTPFTTSEQKVFNSLAALIAGRLSHVG